jgi:cyclic beta-1,2-glucan glucanotransferase
MNEAPMTDSSPLFGTQTFAALRAHATTAPSNWRILHRPQQPSVFPRRIENAIERVDLLVEQLSTMPPAAEGEVFTPLHDLRENTRLLRAAAADINSVRDKITAFPRILLSPEGDEPRIVSAAAAYLNATQGEWSVDSFSVYLEELQRFDPLLLEEHWALPSALKFALLEQCLATAEGVLAKEAPIRASMNSPLSLQIKALREIGQTDWPDILEPMIAFDGLLRQDPAHAYSRMDFESRESYRKKIANLSRYSDCSEIQVAQAVLDLAHAAKEQPLTDPRLFLRRTHIGFYLIDRGLATLASRIGYRPPMGEHLRMFLQRYPDDFYIGGIEIVSFLLLAAILVPLIPSYTIFGGLLWAFFLLLVPATQGAVDLLNNTVTSLFPARSLPKLDLSKGIPDELTTLVVVPTLLLNENQTRELLDELEVRFLANQDPNLHFALLTDLPDSVSRPRENDTDPLVDLAMRSVDELNQRYASHRAGSFLLLHRHRIFNARQGVWMGWERKRGKIIDLNNLLQQEHDSFPVKAGNLEILHRIRYVITLDSDTQLPRGTAAAMIGALAHPLNRAVIDPELRIVTQGYAILQPRVGISVQSASRSRLASIFAGQAGFDPYTRAVSDTYQDLYGEGIFAGKGIYEVAAFHGVLDRRFPRNSLLSHDLIEGAYARAGLVTDIEVIDDYPSHYSAYSRRKHRWVRGDWQIMQWLFSRVPDETGRYVRNPIFTVSRWKIFDNLRRSLVEPLTFILFIAGWLGLPGGALYWTIATLLLMALPTFVRLAFSLGRLVSEFSWIGLRDSIVDFLQALNVTFLNFVFLPHQTLLGVDAIVRALIRRFITGQRLLEWETAAEAESSRSKSNAVDRYLAMTPLVSIFLAGLIAITNNKALIVAAPILFLWACESAFAAWLNQSTRDTEFSVSQNDSVFLRRHALLIWRFFLEFGDESHNYLIPDNIEEDGRKEAARVSPTNLGLLFNARQVAVHFGFLTIPEYAYLAEQSFASIDKLPKHRGHLFNWYSTHTLEPLRPATVSTVDSGNLAASLYSFSTGTRELLQQQLISKELFQGIHNVWQLSSLHAHKTMNPPKISASFVEWIAWVLGTETLLPAPGDRNIKSDAEWWTAEFAQRVRMIADILRNYLPWLLPEFSPLNTIAELELHTDTHLFSLTEAATYATFLESALGRHWATSSDAPNVVLMEKLRTMLIDARENLETLKTSLTTLANTSFEVAEGMDFAFLYNSFRQLLSIGYDVEADQVHAACYDLLSSEARTASYIAVAKGEIPQRSWFRLDRTHTVAFNRPVLVSWTGTMFEYLMPALWMPSYPDTLLRHTLHNIVAIQHDFGRSYRIPWGISECGHSRRDAAGHYGYHAFGIPDVAVKVDADAGPVVSPYSTFLALNLDLPACMRNFHFMESAGWVGSYGFYESADYTESVHRPTLVREWMAHHLGMSLLALTNLLHHNAMQRYFQANPQMRATELLLQEKPIRKSALPSGSARKPRPIATANTSTSQNHSDTELPKAG